MGVYIQNLRFSILSISRYIWYISNRLDNTFHLYNKISVLLREVNENRWSVTQSHAIAINGDTVSGFQHKDRQLIDFFISEITAPWHNYILNMHNTVVYVFEQRIYSLWLVWRYDYVVDNYVWQ